MSSPLWLDFMGKVQVLTTSSIKATQSEGITKKKRRQPSVHLLPCHVFPWVAPLPLVIVRVALLLNSPPLQLLKIILISLTPRSACVMINAWKQSLLDDASGYSLSQGN
ncbi:uncharacterized protein LOC127241901 isoform X2 [Andrographis paniculata]|uniref:uncharacterized protein LOC127241901 isoform X2 n=1 Tax=Andrographis paniculata TaxID=175694 RepID=UPI0021E78D02|nr:uncharacterized protein LOC127241901 isoform X2 [Andrographis paniculata]